MSTNLTLLVDDLNGRGPMVAKCHVEIIPPELLAKIFQEIIALEGPEPILLSPGLGPGEITCCATEFDAKPSIVLSHVCQYWRDIALGTHELWRHTHGQCLDQMEVFLERSRPLTVTLFLDVEHFGGEADGPMHKHGASAIKVHGQRLWRLDLTMVPTWQNVVPLLSSLQAPRLECLTVTSVRKRNGSIDTEICWTPLVNGQTSSLRALVIIPVVNWMPSSSFLHLTHLLLSFDELTELYHPFDIIRLLSNTPALNYLHVNYLFYSPGFQVGDARHPPSTPIPLHHLRSLVFTQCSYSLMHAVISHLALPEDVFIRLQSITDVDEDLAPLPPLALHPVTALDIAIGYCSILMVADGPTSGLWLLAYHDGPYPRWFPWLGTFPGSGCLALAHVTHLHINVDFEFDPEDDLAVFWMAFLAHLPCVTDLAVMLGFSSNPPWSCYGQTNDVSHTPTTILSRALNPGEPGSEAWPGLVLCPALNTLTVEWTEAMTEDEVKSYEEFPRMLRARARAGYAIRRVVMQTRLDSGFSRAQAEDFVQKLRCATEGYETEYELLVKEEYGPEVCAYEMRDVWRVNRDEEERYWKTGEEEKLRYGFLEEIGGYGWPEASMW